MKETSQAQLLRKIAKLETLNDQIAAELRYLDQLARSLGFQEGLKTLKEAALEMLKEGRSNPKDGANPQG